MSRLCAQNNDPDSRGTTSLCALIELQDRSRVQCCRLRIDYAHAVTTSGSRSTREIESELFRPGPRFVLAAFGHPLLKRERELTEAARWLGLDELLSSDDAASPTSSGVTGRWLRLLRRRDAELESDIEVRELHALMRALETQAATADREGTSISISQLWTEWSEELRRSLGLAREPPPEGDQAAEGGGHATSASTLRGRRWGNLRARLAEALARLTEQNVSANLLPRAVRSASTFARRHYAAIHDALTEPSCGGLAVIVAPPGSGKSELALSYAREQAARYDHVFWLRASHRLQLEQDFLEMARILVRVPGGRDHLRREAFRILENTARWLIVFESVRDPAVLLPYLPWNPEGHKLCTFWTDTRVDGALEQLSQARTATRSPRLKDARVIATEINQRIERAQQELVVLKHSAWSTYLNVHPAGPGAAGCLLERLTDAEAATFLSRELPQVTDPAAVAELASRVSPSRLATVLAAKWIDYSGDSIAGYITRWDALAEPAGGTEDERCGYRAALISLRGLSYPDRWPVRGGERRSREAAAADLLRRLEPYGADTFPSAILDDPEWDTHDSPLDDPRLAVLDALSLADKADRSRHVKYFAVSPIVRAAVSEERGIRSPTEHLTIAARTLLHLLQERASVDSLPARLELLPHAEHLAQLLAPTPDLPLAKTPDERTPDAFPMLAIELLAYAAAGHLAEFRVRTASERLHRIREIGARYRAQIRRTLSAAEQIWPGDDLPRPPEDYQFDPPINRLSQLVQSMRLDGYPQVAQSLFAAISAALPMTGPDLGDQANLYFYGAIACRDADDGPGATRAIEEALRIWTSLGNEQGVTAAASVTALLLRDAGDLVEARRRAQSALRDQRDLVTRSRGSSDRARIELARVLSLLGGISREQGRWKEAASLMREAADTWASFPQGRSRDTDGGANPATSSRLERPAYRAGLRINEISARSSSELLNALLGDVADAEQAALLSWRSAEEIYPGGHRKSTGILANVAEVARLAGDVTRGRDLHVQALEMSERLWTPDHRITTRIRRACAVSLLDAGDPRASFAQLQHILRLPSRSVPGDVLARGRAWASLGRLLLDVSLAREPDDERRLTLLLARRVLEHGQGLLDGVADPAHRHPDTVGTLLGRAEIAITEGDERAVDLAREALDLVEEHFALTPLPTVLPRARIIRARTLRRGPALDPAEMGHIARETAALEAELEVQASLHSPAERFEVALAAIAVDASQPPGRRARDAALGRVLYDHARTRLDKALGPLAKQMAGEPHQLLARHYSELARLAYRFVGSRQRARNERERDRVRPIFDLGSRQLEELERALRDDEQLLRDMRTTVTAHAIPQA